MTVIRDNVDRVMSGNWTFTSNVTLPAATIDENALKAATMLPAAKLTTRFPVTGCKQAVGSDVVAQTEIIHIAQYAGIVTSVEAVVAAVPTGGGVDKKVTIDVQKSTGGAAFATILSTTFDVDSADTARVAVEGTIDAAKDDYVAGDIFQIVAAVSGSTGDQAKGLAVTVFFEERPVT
jgi:hypothetical protein